MKPKTAIEKGKLLENFVAGLLRTTGIDPRARRTPGSGNGRLKSDIDTTAGFSIECKNTKTASLPEWWRQTLRQANDFNKPAVVWHPPRQPMDESLIILRLHDFLEVLKKAKEPVVENPDRTMQYKLKRLDSTLKGAMKAMEKEGVSRETIYKLQDLRTAAKDVSKELSTD